MRGETISSKFVYSTRRYDQLVTEGDKFRLKDIDGYAPTGEYTINAIRVDYVTVQGAFMKSTHVRVWYQDRSTGSWTRDVNCVVTPLVKGRC